MKPGFYWILKALLSHYWRHPWQTLFLCIGLVSGVGLWSAVQIINQHAVASYQQAQSLLGAQANYWIRSRLGTGIEQSLYIKLRRDGFRQVIPLIELEVSTAEGISISIIATDLLVLPENEFEGGQPSQDFAETWLNFVQPPYRARVPPVLAFELGLEQGDQLELRDGRLLPPALIQTREQQGRRVLVDIGAAVTGGFEPAQLPGSGQNRAAGVCSPCRESARSSRTDRESTAPRPAATDCEPAQSFNGDEPVIVCSWTVYCL